MEGNNIKPAVNTAMKFIKSTYSEQDIFDVLLEEIKEEPGGKEWAITISFKRKIPDDIPISFTKLIDNRIESKFKKIIVNKKSLEIKGMTHREFRNE